MITKYTAVVEVRLTDDKLKELENWGVEPTDHINAVISDHLSDRGLLNSVATWQINDIGDDVRVSAFTTLNKVAESIQRSNVLDDIEQDILIHSCPNGVCDD